MTDLGKIWCDGRLKPDSEIEYDWRRPQKCDWRRRLSRFQWLTSLTYGRDKRPLKWILLPLVYTVSKNVPPLTCYNFEIHNPITISFGTCVTEKVKKSDGALFSHLTYLLPSASTCERGNTVELLDFLSLELCPQQPRAERIDYKTSRVTQWYNMSRESKDWRNQAATGWILAMQSEKCNFRVFLLCQVG